MLTDRLDQRSATSHLYTHLIHHGVMALNLKNAEVERLAAEVARLTGESEDRGHPARIRGTPSAAEWAVESGSEMS